MILKTLTYAAGCLALASSSMASVLVQNIAGNDEGIYSLFNEQGQLLSSDVTHNVRLGSFADGFNVSDAWDSGNLSALEGNFLQFGQRGSLFQSDEIDGLLQALFSTSDPSFADSSIFLWISDSADFLNPLGQHLIFRFDTIFSSDPSAEQIVSLMPGAGDLLVGEFGNFTYDHSLPLGPLPGFSLETAVVVPEPATYALVIGSALLGIATLRHRKRARN